MNKFKFNYYHNHPKINKLLPLFGRMKSIKEGFNAVVKSTEREWRRQSKSSASLNKLKLIIDLNTGAISKCRLQ
jgi:hypothetical protein